VLVGGGEFGSNGFHLVGDVFDADALRVAFPERRMFLDRLVHPRLSDRWIIDFAMSVAAIADEVDDDIGTESIAVIDGESRDANHCVDVFRVYVKDRNRLATGELGCEAR